MAPGQVEAVRAASVPARGRPAVAGYEILEELGRGGMGVVYKARQIGLKRLVALKMILSGAHAHGDQKARFRAEAEAVACLQHPNIVQVYEVGEHDGLPYFSLEFVDGGTLDRKLNGTPLPPATAAHLVEALARAMQAAHEHGVVHRDLKPANVLLMAGGPDVPVDHCTPKITDFGLAKQLHDSSGQTASGAILGTPSYMAPEQAQGKTHEIGTLSDVYALGAILYECLTGRPPFKGATMVETLEQVRSVEVAPPTRLQPRCPRDLETVCLKCLQKEPTKRYPTAAALADDLKRFLDGEPIQARRVGSWERAARWVRRRPAAAALVVLLAAVALALPLAGLQFYAQRAREREAERRRLEEARAEVRDLLARGQTAALGQDWKYAEVLLEKARASVAANPGLAELAADVEAARAPVKGRLAALDVSDHFRRDRDEALFDATLATGEDFQANRQAAREKARSALAAAGLSPEGSEPLTLGASFTDEEKADITNGSYALLLVLAETEARRLPGQTDGEYSQSLRRALALLDRADGLGVRTRAIHLRRARYLSRLSDATGAARESERVRALADETDLDPQDHYLVGHELYSRGDLAGAEREFHRALQLDARHFWAHYFLGICCMTTGKPDVAVAHFTTCQGQQPKLVWVYLLRGFALGQAGDFAGAEADFDRALTLEPSPAARYVLYNNRGVMRLGREGEWARGVDDLTRAAALRPDQYHAHASLAEAYRSKGRADDAARELEQAIALAGRQVKAGDVRPAALGLLHYSRARLRLEHSDRDAAVRDLEEAARLAGDDRGLRARAEADRGRVLHLQGRFDDALAAYDDALNADPGRADVHRWRGEVLLVQARYGDAAAALDAYLEKGGAAEAAVFRQRGLARAKLGRHAEAADDYGRALDATPKGAERVPLLLSRGEEYLASNALPQARGDFEEARRLDPASPDACLACAHVRVRLGEDVWKAVADADQALAGDPKEPRLWHGAARVYAQAAAQLRPETGRDQARAGVRRRLEKRAVALVRAALGLVPADQRPAYWREKVLTDGALTPLRDLPEFAQLAAGLGDRQR
jgi:tetratricopeptide (TPR) repeat protein